MFACGELCGEHVQFRADLDPVLYFPVLQNFYLTISDGDVFSF